MFKGLLAGMDTYFDETYPGIPFINHPCFCTHHYFYEAGYPGQPAEDEILKL